MKIVLQQVVSFLSKKRSGANRPTAKGFSGANRPTAKGFGGANRDTGGFEPSAPQS